MCRKTKLKVPQEICHFWPFFLLLLLPLLMPLWQTSDLIGAGVLLGWFNPSFPCWSKASLNMLLLPPGRSTDTCTSSLWDRHRKVIEIRKSLWRKVVQSPLLWSNFTFKVNPTIAKSESSSTLESYCTPSSFDSWKLLPSKSCWPRGCHWTRISVFYCKLTRLPSWNQK